MSARIEEGLSVAVSFFDHLKNSLQEVAEIKRINRGITFQEWLEETFTPEEIEEINRSAMEEVERMRLEDKQGEQQGKPCVIRMLESKQPITLQSDSTI